MSAPTNVPLWLTTTGPAHCGPTFFDTFLVCPMQSMQTSRGGRHGGMAELHCRAERQPAYGVGELSGGD